MSQRAKFVLIVLAVAGATAPAGGVSAQAGDNAPDSLAAAAALAPAPAGLPVFLTVGLGFGQRSDACSTCPSPENTSSFTGHLSLGKKLGHGLGVGLEASAWRRGHPGPLGAADSTGVPTPTTLSNTLGNASIVFSWQVWRVWVHAGGGIAYGAQDLVSEAGDAESIVTASGLGVGYTVGGGVAIPVAGPMSLAFFANWNAGSYDLVSPTAVLERGAEHRYLELGVGLSLR